MLLFTHHPTQIPNWNEQIDSNKKTPKVDKTHKAENSEKHQKKPVVGQNTHNKNSE